ncbi:hypothetical protein LEMLEM_LOCUS21584, partial [Lemmus lemmus]
KITTRKLYYLKYCLAISSSLFWLTLSSWPTPSPLICVAPRGGGLPGKRLTYAHLRAWLYGGNAGGAVLTHYLLPCILLCHAHLRAGLSKGQGSLFY